jgi:DNA-binding CsgD family transcriptional regulator
MTASGVAMDPTTNELQRRLAQAIAEAHGVLGVEPDAFDAGLDGLSQAISAMEARLAHDAHGAHWRETTAAHAGELDRLRVRYQARFDALSSAQKAAAALREHTAPSELLRRAPQELCLSSQLERAVLSLVREGTMVAEAAYFHDDPVGAVEAVEALAGDPPRLEHPLVEAEILRRRRATIVTQAQVHPRIHRPMAQIMGWHAYVAAPLVVRGRVIGVIHADAGGSGRALDVLDGDVLWTFASGLAAGYETVSLRRSLRRQREEMRQFVDWLIVRTSELSDVSIQFVAEQTATTEPPASQEATSAGPDVVDRAAFEDLLTRRELDVLRLLARGESNSAVAAKLVISESTVKFHVLNVLRKLQVTNRAAAVAQYHRVLQQRALAPDERPSRSGPPTGTGLG